MSATVLSHFDHFDHFDYFDRFDRPQSYFDSKERKNHKRKLNREYNQR